MARQGFILETEGVPDMPAIIDDVAASTICFGHQVTLAVRFLQNR